MAIGIYHIHRQGIVHRDINPRNVLLISDKKHCKVHFCLLYICFYPSLINLFRLETLA